MKVSLIVLCALLFLGSSCVKASNVTATWVKTRNELRDLVFGYGQGKLSNKSVPDQILSWPEAPGIKGLVWNMSTLFEITSTVFFSPAKQGQRSKEALFFHHGHSNCLCPVKPGEGVLAAAKCRPGCNSSMPSGGELEMGGYSWWDLYNVSTWANGVLEMDVFIFSMPLKVGRSF